MFEYYPYLFILLLPFVAFLYSSVGHGGASGYLALMILFEFSPEKMKSTALLLNLFVAAISFYHFYKEGHFNKKLFFVFALSSIPMSFIGGYINIDDDYYKKILAFLLIFAIVKVLNLVKSELKPIVRVKKWEGLMTGALIGFFSGLIGIGGGVILTPVILFFKWGRIKEAAAVSAIFIWVNSFSGISGQFVSGVTVDIQSFYLVIIAAFGGFFGSYFGSKKLNNSVLSIILAVVLFIASLKLFLS